MLPVALARSKAFPRFICLPRWCSVDIATFGIRKARYEAPPHVGEWTARCYTGPRPKGRFISSHHQYHSPRPGIGCNQRSQCSCCRCLVRLPCGEGWAAGGCVGTCGAQWPARCLPPVVSVCRRERLPWPLLCYVALGTEAAKACMLYCSLTWSSTVGRDDLSIATRSLLVIQIMGKVELPPMSSGSRIQTAEQAAPARWMTLDQPT